MFAMFNQFFASITRLFRAFDHTAGALEQLAKAGEVQATVFSTKTQLTCQADLITARAELDRIMSANPAAAARTVDLSTGEVPTKAVATKAPVRRGRKPAAKK